MTANDPMRLTARLVRFLTISNGTTWQPTDGMARRELTKGQAVLVEGRMCADASPARLRSARTLVDAHGSADWVCFESAWIARGENLRLAGTIRAYRNTRSNTHMHVWARRGGECMDRMR
jgi:hypothetical protein